MKNFFLPVMALTFLLTMPALSSELPEIRIVQEYFPPYMLPEESPFHKYSQVKRLLEYYDKALNNKYKFDFIGVTARRMQQMIRETIPTCTITSVIVGKNLIDKTIGESEEKAFDISGKRNKDDVFMTSESVSKVVLILNIKWTMVYRKDNLKVSALMGDKYSPNWDKLLRDKTLKWQMPFAIEWWFKQGWLAKRRPLADFEDIWTEPRFLVLPQENPFGAMLNSIKKNRADIVMGIDNSFKAAAVIDKTLGMNFLENLEFVPTYREDKGIGYAHMMAFLCNNETACINLVRDINRIAPTIRKTKEFMEYVDFKPDTKKMFYDLSDYEHAARHDDVATELWDNTLIK